MHQKSHPLPLHRVETERATGGHRRFDGDADRDAQASTDLPGSTYYRTVQVIFF